MITHSNKVLLVKIKDYGFVKGDAFWPKLTDKIKDATRLANPKDAKKYTATAVNRLKKEISESFEYEIVHATEIRDDKFNLVDVVLDK